MAKAFDDNERKLIKDKLKEGALLFIQQQGVRKTSVDELVKYANISKECVVIGASDRVEIWSQDNWNTELNDNEDKLSDLAENLFDGVNL